MDSCSASTYDDSAGCVTAVVAAINAARAQEGLHSLQIPRNWHQLTPPEQLFVATNLERTVRGLPPLAGLTASLNMVAGTGASDGEDPPQQANSQYSTVAGNWIQGYSNPLEVVYIWVYDDGPGSSNVDCSTSHPAGCWGHRNNLLVSLPCTTCEAGAAFTPTDAGSQPLSYAEVIVESSLDDPLSFTWATEEPFLR